jgi:intein-encoded DNA endonuclease-like protein
MDPIKQLIDVFEPFEQKIKQVTEALKIAKNDSNSNPKDVQRLERICYTYILMLLRVFVDSPIQIKINKKDNEHLKYSIYWIDRRKYFKESKKELLDFFNRFIRVVHRNNDLTLIDLKLTGNRRVELLIESKEK